MATSTGSASRPVPILNYHAISDGPGSEIAPFAVRPDEFARHLDLIVAGGHTALTVSQYVDLLDSGQVPPGTVVITFDDGFEDNLTVAAPMLVARQMPATIYVATGHLPGCPGGPAGRPLGPMISWDRLGDLEAAGLEIGAHSHSHPQLDLLRRRDASREIGHSRDLLQDALGHSVASFAYPHGYASSWLQGEVRRRGFRSACGVREAFSHATDLRWLLARLTVGATTTYEQLEQWLQGSGAPLAGRHEHMKTRAWRGVRRARALALPPGRSAAQAGRTAPTSRGPVRLIGVELAVPLVDIRPVPSQVGEAYGALRMLVTLHRHPLGEVSVRLPAEGLDAGLVADAIWDRVSKAVQDHCRADGLPVPEKLTATGLVHPATTPCSWQTALSGTTPPHATIVITTCDGAGGELAATVSGALAQSYPDFEVVVVDNRPATSGVAAALDAAFPGEPRLRYAAEDRPSLGHARNRGAAVARGELVAFTDDDVTIDPDWLGCLVAGFDHPEVACVTGLILPLEIETAAQRLLEEFGGYAKGFDRRTWDCDEHRLDGPLYPYTVGAFGSGANAAFRSDALDDIGGFDGCLGAGTPSRGGEDLDIFVTCVQRGYRIVYEPAAVVRHAHLREMSEVHQKVRDYGVGLGAMLTKHLLRDRSSAAALLGRLPAGAVHLLSTRSTKNALRSSSYPRSLIVAELEGLAYGPVAYLRSRRST